MGAGTVIPACDRVFVIRERAMGSDDLNYVTVINDREYVLLALRNGRYEVYPDGYANGIPLRAVSRPKSDDVLKEFRRVVNKSGWVSIAF